ncbi:MAG: indole-3-glycerol phosphate synthase [Candidatus Omnitrophica bacterium CG_4_9_14_0_2_um_filter_42_8]|nr:MAG: indole-3-glycerol phosphate synthase [Candidatus Omnitrophica bacterium CG_4_9_14_0_2_um_filter_42_8]
MKNFLQDIITLKRKEIETLKSKRPITEFIDSKRLLRGIRPFKEAISSGDGLNLIAEIKKKSPSFGKNFFRKLDIAGIANIYKREGAKAMSVLTDKKFFSGSILHINEVKRAIDLPVLRKDFIIDEYQVYESRYFGADAILLIARILSVDQIKSFMHLAKNINMDVIVEIHNENDLEKALLASPDIIGINNRDLDTLEISIENTLRLITKIPKEIVTISESGISSNVDIEKIKDTEINAVLIGAAFLESGDIAARVREVMGNEGKG